MMTAEKNSDKQPPFDRLARLQRMLADELRQPLKDEAGIIIPQGVDAAHRAGGMRRIIGAIEETAEQRPVAGQNQKEV